MILNLKRICLFVAVSGLYITTGCGQSAVEEHIVTLGKDPDYIENNHFKQGTNVNPKGEKLDLNNYYLRKAGKPILPIMGEFHYSRYPRAEWEQSLLQMKAAGIQIIALYCFWIHHEEKEGTFRFDDNRDVRYFLQLCAKHGLMAMVRIGPWAHGEARNGGFPDWYVKKKLKNGTDRSSINGSIQPEVATWYAKLAEQFQGLYYKDGGPIIGLQVDNEVSSKNSQSSGYQYMAALKTLAVKDGMDVPYYVVTGWPGPVVPEDEVMPLWGGYADAPWTQNTKELPPNPLYAFSTDRRSKSIGNDLNKYNSDNNNAPVDRHPFLTVEMGSGIQMTYLRRPLINTPDIMGMMYTRLGSGANMLGYYVFHGTQHPLSWNNEYPTQESKFSIYPYPNDYPLISYYFQAPLGEWGYTGSSYHDLKLLHQFLNSYAQQFAPMFTTVPGDNPGKAEDTTSLRYAIRSKGNAGFVLFNNYARHQVMTAHKQVAFTIKTATETVRIPEKGGIDIGSGTYGIMPFNNNAGGVLIKYATVHPSAILDNGTYFYYPIGDIKPEFKLDNSNIGTITFNDGKVNKEGNYIYLTSMSPGKNCVADISTKDNKKVKLVILTKETARYSYLFNIKGVKTLVLTDKQAFYDEVKDSLTIRSIDEPAFTFYTYPAIRIKNKAVHAITSDGLFSKYEIKLPAGNANVSFQQISDNAKLDKYTASISETPLKPAYTINYIDTLPFKAYELKLPKRLPANVYDVLVNFNYHGNTAALYADGKIVADDYFSGQPMPFSLKRQQDKLGNSKFILQISPLVNKTNIYFEPGTKLDFKNTDHAGLTSITVKPVYQAVF